MESPQVPIKPIDFVVTSVLTGFAFNVIDFTPFKSVTFRVVLYAENTPKKVEVVVMQGEDYTKWGQDDTYLIQFIAKTLGLELP